MKVSRAWLQRFFDTPLPQAEELRDVFTFHAFEVEEVEGDVLDIKVLPDRAGYAMSHRGIAYELSAILNMPMKDDPFSAPLPQWNATDGLSIDCDPRYVIRHTAALVKGVKVGPSPAWLKEALESVGQRSINNIVDASNFVMLNIGQPNHAFDAGKVTKEGKAHMITIREAKKGEKVLLLSGEEKELHPGIFIFADGVKGTPLDIAGVKGGMDSGVTEATTDLFVSAGNYDGTLLRKASQAARVVTDASQRFQNRPSPELTMYGMRDVLALIQEVAGGEIAGVIDFYPKKAEQKTASVSVSVVQDILGKNFTEKEIEDAFTRLQFSYEKKGGTYTVTPPWQRSDIVIPEDLAEEVGRIVGYDHVTPVSLSKPERAPEMNAAFYWNEKTRAYLMDCGFSEVMTSVFTNEKGDRQISNKVDSDRPYLRKTLTPSVAASLKMNALNRPLLGLSEIRIFELGKVFTKEGETWHLALGMTGKNKAKQAMEDLMKELGAEVPVSASGEVAEIDFSALVQKLSVPASYEWLPAKDAPKYVPFSRYPFIDRDIAVWTPEGTEASAVESVIREHAGALLARCYQFDSFSKDGRTSYAFRMVFQSDERTLTDDDVNPQVAAMTDAMNAKEGWQVR